MQNTSISPHANTPSLPPASRVVEERESFIGTFKSVLLPNGINCLMFEIPEAHAVSMQITFAVGSMHEKASEHGAAHFLEHLFFGELPGEDSRSELEFQVLARGGWRNARTSTETTSYAVRFPADEAAYAANLFAKQMANPNITDTTVVREKQIITNEFFRTAANPFAKASIEIANWIFPEANLDHLVLGNPEEINSLSPTTIREFYRRHYVAEHATIAVAGPASALAAIEPIIAQSFGQMPNLEREAARMEPKVRCRFDTPGMDRVLEYPLPTGGISLKVILPGVARCHPDFHLAEMVAGILGGSTASRLHQRLRTAENLVYSCSASSNQVGDCGTFEICTDADSPELATHVLRIISEELHRLAEAGPTRTELGAYCLGRKISSLDLKGQDNSICRSAISCVQNHGRVILPEEVQDNLLRTTGEDLKRFLQERLGKDRALIVATGNVTNGQIDATLLNLF